MNKKYVGKLKSFDEIKNILKIINSSWNIDLIVFLRDNELKDITLTQFTKCSYDNGMFVLTENLFSEIKPVTEYYAIGNDGSVYNLDKALDNTIERFKKAYNYWDSEEQAQEIEKSMKLYRAMKWWSYKFDGGYNGSSGRSYKLFKNGSVAYFERITYNINDICFSSTEKALECYNWLKKEDLL